MTGEGDDLPTVDGETFRERVGEVDDITSVTVANPPAESLVASFEDDIGKAMRSAMWHTIVDGAANEAFVDDFEVRHLRDAINTLRSNGFASGGLTKTDLYGDEVDEIPEGAAFFFGDDAADLFEEYTDEAERVETPVDEDFGFDAGLPGVDGFLCERVEDLPSHLIVFVDVAAVGRVPAEARNVPVGLDRTPSVSSPIVVTQPEGIAVVNIAE